MQNSSTSFGGSGESTQWTRERLDSWKEVASFFRREVRTVQLWEKSEGLPVRRQHHKKLGSVYAYRQELEAWWAARSAIHAGPSDPKDAHKTERLEQTIVRGEDSSEFPRIIVVPFEAIHSPLD